MGRYSGRLRVTRTRVIDAPLAQVRARVIDLRCWRDWNPWLGNELDAEVAFAIGTVAMILVALSFMAFTHRVAHAGSAYAYISHTFGSRMGFIAGWSLLLTYVGFATGQAALVGSFTAEALKGVSIDIGSAWLAIGGGAMLLA